MNREEELERQLKNTQELVRQAYIAGFVDGSTNEIHGHRNHKSDIHYVAYAVLGISSDDFDKKMEDLKNN